MRRFKAFLDRDDTSPVRRCNLASAGLMAALAWLILLTTQGFAEDHKTRTITLLSSGAYTAATGYSSAFDVSAYLEGQVFIDVTAESGSSTLDVTIQTSPDNSAWYTHTAVAQITETGKTRQPITNYGNYFRIKYVVGGTSFTFSVTGVFKN